MQNKDLACETMPRASVRELCRRVQQNLEYSRGGHGLIRGYLGYYCTTETAAKVFCSGAPIVVEDIDAVIEASRAPTADALRLDSRLSACMDWFVGAQKALKEPRVEGDDSYDAFRCDAGTK